MPLLYNPRRMRGGLRLYTDQRDDPMRSPPLRYRAPLDREPPGHPGWVIIGFGWGCFIGMCAAAVAATIGSLILPEKEAAAIAVGVAISISAYAPLVSW